MRVPEAMKRYLASIAKQGGQARIRLLTPRQRRALARKAARVRWTREKAAKSEKRRTK